MRLDSRAVLMLAACALVVAAACHDSSISDPPAGPKVIQSRLVGQWTLTTQMDTFSFETGPSTPDCTQYNPYCTHYRATVNGAYLSGVLQVKDSFGLKGIDVPIVQASGALTRAFCDSIDYKTLTGCTHVGDQVAVQYTGLIEGVPDSTTTGSLNLYIGEPDNGTGFFLSVRSYNGLTYAGDSIYGKFLWGMDAGRSPPTYIGRIVLHRVK